MQSQFFLTQLYLERARLPLQEWTPFLSSILNPIQTPRLSHLEPHHPIFLHLCLEPYHPISLVQPYGRLTLYSGWGYLGARALRVPTPIIVYSVANYTPHRSRFWANI